jgi:hypothetical protein
MSKKNGEEDEKILEDVLVPDQPTKKTEKAET